MRPATRRNRKAGRRSSSTPTATASATSLCRANAPVDPTKDKRFGGGFYSVAPAPDGSVWGIGPRLPWRGRPAESGRESAVDGARRSLRAAVQRSRRTRRGLLAARRRRRSQRRVLGGAGERSSRELRSPQVQGPAQRPEGDRAALPGGLDAYTPSRCRR